MAKEGRIEWAHAPTPYEGPQWPCERRAGHHQPCVLKGASATYLNHIRNSSSSAYYR